MFGGELPGSTCPLSATTLGVPEGCPTSHILEPSPTAAVPLWPLLLFSRSFSFTAIMPRRHHPTEGEVLFRLWLDIQGTQKTLSPG